MSYSSRFSHRFQDQMRAYTAEPWWSFLLSFSTPATYEISEREIPVQVAADHHKAWVSGVGSIGSTASGRIEPTRIDAPQVVIACNNSDVLAGSPDKRLSDLLNDPDVSSTIQLFLNFKRPNGSVVFERIFTGQRTGRDFGFKNGSLTLDSVGQKCLKSKLLRQLTDDDFPYAKRADIGQGMPIVIDSMSRAVGRIIKRAFASNPVADAANSASGKLGDITTNQAPTAQTWTVTFSSSTAFSISGSVSGSQGTGTITADFVSINGEVRIPAASWAGAHATSDVFTFVVDATTGGKAAFSEAPTATPLAGIDTVFWNETPITSPADLSFTAGTNTTVFLPGSGIGPWAQGLNLPPCVISELGVDIRINTPGVTACSIPVVLSFVEGLSPTGKVLGSTLLYPRINISSITRSGTTATVTLNSGGSMIIPYAVGDFVTISGAAQAQYNGTFAVASVSAPLTFTYTVAGSPATPATGTIIVAGYTASSAGTITTSAGVRKNILDNAVSFKGGPCWLRVDTSQSLSGSQPGNYNLRSSASDVYSGGSLYAYLASSGQWEENGAIGNTALDLNFFVGFHGFTVSTSADDGTGHPVGLVTFDREIPNDVVITADVRGPVDDGSGTYTGTPGASITSPEAVLLWLFAAINGQSLADFSSASAAAAKTFYASVPYRLASQLLENKTVQEYFLDIARQCRSTFSWDNTQARIDVIPTTPSGSPFATFTFDDFTDSGDGDPKFKLTPIADGEVINHVDVKYRKAPRVSGDIAYEATLTREGPSVSDKGVLARPDLMNCDFLQDDAAALDFALAMLSIYSPEKRRANWSTVLPFLDAMKQDEVAFDLTAGPQPTLDDLDGSQMFRVETKRINGANFELDWQALEI